VGIQGDVMFKFSDISVELSKETLILFSSLLLVRLITNVLGVARVKERSHAIRTLIHR